MQTAPRYIRKRRPVRSLIVRDIVKIVIDPGLVVPNDLINLPDRKSGHTEIKRRDVSLDFLDLQTERVEIKMGNRWQFVGGDGIRTQFGFAQMLNADDRGCSQSQLLGDFIPQIPIDDLARSVDREWIENAIFDNTRFNHSSFVTRLDAHAPSGRLELAQSYMLMRTYGRKAIGFR